MVYAVNSIQNQNYCPTAVCGPNIKLCFYTLFYYAVPVATCSSSATLPADANTILSMLQKYSFPGIYWEILAQDLFKNLTVPRKYYELKNDYARLKAVVTDWTAGVGVVGRWETIVRAVRTCHEGQIANNIALEIGLFHQMIECPGDRKRKRFGLQ